MPTTTRVRNDLRQYDDLADEWWRPGGAFSMLHWLARARAALVPPAARPCQILADPRALAAECARYGVVLEVRGIRPTALPMLRWIVRRTGEVPIVPSRIKAVLYQGRGVKQ